MARQQRMSRAVRTARGAFGALAATLLAAASHGLAGGTVTPLAVLATSILALPLCVLLAGRLGSLWRLSLAVAVSQFVYHWSFAGLGLAAGGGSGAAMPPHSLHLHTLGFSPEFADAGAADGWMWALHAAAAALTILLLHRGERAALALAGLLRRALPLALPAAVAVPERAVIRPAARAAETARPAVCLSAISHRGPPARACSR